jgi:hypothetical protein
LPPSGTVVEGEAAFVPVGGDVGGRDVVVEVEPVFAPVGGDVGGRDVVVVPCVVVVVPSVEVVDDGWSDVFGVATLQPLRSAPTLSTPTSSVVVRILRTMAPPGDASSSTRGDAQVGGRRHAQDAAVPIRFDAQVEV